MHPDERTVSAGLVRKLIESQFPTWHGLDLRPVASSGTDNALFRLGDDKLVRMPRIHWAADDPLKEYEWLPRLAPSLPLEIPVPLALGQPGCGYPWHWTVCPWLEGTTQAIDETSDPVQTAMSLALFIRTLHQLDAAGGPTPEEAGSSRGVPLATRDEAFRKAHAQLDPCFDRQKIQSIGLRVSARQRGRVLRSGSTGTCRRAIFSSEQGGLLR